MKAKMIIALWMVMIGTMAQDVDTNKEFSDNQRAVNEKLTGVWVLDSVQVKENMPGDLRRMTVPSNGQAKFNGKWMRRFQLDGTGKASYLENTYSNVLGKSFYILDVPYTIKDIDGNTATLIIDGVPEYKILSMQLLSDHTLLINYSFSTTYNFRSIEVYWTMFYHKSEHPDSDAIHLPL